MIIEVSLVEKCPKKGDLFKVFREVCTLAIKRICIQHIGDDASEERQVQKAGTSQFYRLVYLGARKDNQERASDRIENV